MSDWGNSPSLENTCGQPLTHPPCLLQALTGSIASQESPAQPFIFSASQDSLINLDDFGDCFLDEAFGSTLMGPDLPLHETGPSTFSQSLDSDSDASSISQMSPSSRTQSFSIFSSPQHESLSSDLLDSLLSPTQAEPSIFQQPQQMETETIETMPRRRRSPPGGNLNKTESKLRAKEAHSLVERRYRANLSDKIMQLHRTLLAARSGVSEHRNAPLGIHRLSEPKVRKGEVLTEAIDYVNQAEVEMRHMADDILRLNARVDSLQKLVSYEQSPIPKQMGNSELWPLA